MSTITLNWIERLWSTVGQHHKQFHLCLRFIHPHTHAVIYFWSHMSSILWQDSENNHIFILRIWEKTLCSMKALVIRRVLFIELTNVTTVDHIWCENALKDCRVQIIQFSLVVEQLAKCFYYYRLHVLVFIIC